MNVSSPPLIFLSHASVDTEIARSLKRHLETVLPGAEVFVSSDPEDLKLGDPWVSKILLALERAKLVLTLTTQRGLNRKWVWFEAGRTWFSPVPCVPCCLGEIRKSSLPAPFESLQAMNLDEVADLKCLVSRAAHELHIPESTADWAMITEELIRLDIRAEERQRTIQDPFSSELRQEVEQEMGRLDSGSKEVLRMLLKYGELSERVAENKVRESGKYTNQTILLFGLADHTGWLEKTKSSPFPNVSRDEDCYKLVGQVQPYLAAWFEQNS
jgi:hypothetical protein